MKCRRDVTRSGVEVDDTSIPLALRSCMTRCYLNRNYRSVCRLAGNIICGRILILCYLGAEWMYFGLVRNPTQRIRGRGLIWPGVPLGFVCAGRGGAA